MLIDMHAHSSGISRCCRIDARKVLETAKNVGIDGLILTNHYQESYIQDKNSLAFAEKYANEYFAAENAARETGVKLFFGAEITAKRYNNAHILLYGLTPAMLLENPDIYDYTLEDMNALIHAAGGLAVQAHPFRNGGVLLDTNLLDGVEINCHPLYDDTHSDRLLAIAKEQGLFVTCGGDYHADTYRAVCGTYFPDDTKDMAGIIAHLKASPEIRLSSNSMLTTRSAS